MLNSMNHIHFEWDQSHGICSRDAPELGSIRPELGFCNCSSQNRTLKKAQPEQELCFIEIHCYSHKKKHIKPKYNANQTTQITNCPMLG